MYFYFDLKKVTEKEGTIRVILSQQGNKAVIYTGQKIAIKDWIKGTPKAIAKNDNINLFLGKYKSAFNKYITDVQLANELPSLDKAKAFIISRIKNPNNERGQKDIQALIIQFRDEKKSEMKEGALKPFNTLSNHLTDFNPNIQFSDFNKDFQKKFSEFLSKKSKHKKGAKDLQNPTINKMLVTLKVFCKWAQEKRYTSATDWKEIKRVKEEEQEIINLKMAELITYFNFDFKDKINLERAKDVFCFGSFLGLRYNDLKQVNKQTARDGYLRIRTHKGNKELKIKLIPEALYILEKYNNTLPLDISNQKLNKNIKAGVKLAGIDRQETIIIQHLSNQTQVQKYVHELLSIHDARKTFISLSLEGGLSITEVMQMSTHSSYKSFSRYVKLEQSKVDVKLTKVFSHLKAV